MHSRASMRRLVVSVSALLLTLEIGPITEARSLRSKLAPREASRVARSRAAESAIVRGKERTQKSKLPAVRRAGRHAMNAGTGCGQCERILAKAPKSSARRSARRTVYTRCHPKGYVDPAVARNLKNALRDLRRAGIKPEITSTWRSSAYQASLHRCSLSGRCRHARGLYHASRPGRSRHEAGFAVDIAGVAARSSGRRYVTPRGRRIIQIMNRNGFKWRYGLADPVHFEADPRRHGYRTLRQAIKFNQSYCSLPSPRKLARSARNKKEAYKVARAALSRKLPARGKTPVRPAAAQPRSSSASA